MRAQFFGLAVWLLAAGSAVAQNVPTGATFGKVYPLGGTPDDIVLDESRGRLYLVRATANRVEIFDIARERVTGFFNVGTYPLSAAMSLDNQFLYVANTQSSSVSVVDLSSGAVAQTISLPARPEGIEVGADGRVLITTQGAGPLNTSNQLLILDRRQQQGQQVIPVLAPPPITTPAPLPQVFVGRPATAFPGRLIRSADGQFLIGMVAINQTTNSAQTTLFVYEAVSGTVLRNRTVTGQSTVLSISPDGSRVMAGSTLYDVTTLAVIGQMNTANLPFFINPLGFNPGVNLQANFGGSAFSSDGSLIYNTFNTAALGQRPEANVLYVASAKNLGVRLGLKLPESILGRMVSDAAGRNLWALSESGLMLLPVGNLYDYPILQPETNQVFLAVDNCNKGVARAQVRVANLGKGKLTFAVPNVTTALVTQVSSGMTPATVTFIMEPGRTGIVRQPGTNLFTGAGGGGGFPINITLSSNEAINYPNSIRVYMNFRQSDQRGVIYPVPTTLNNGAGLVEMVLDEPRKRIYASNAGFNRIEVFDIEARRFLEPIEVGQLPRSIAMTPDRNTLYVGNNGGESISIVDLETRRVVGEVEFPPVPRAGNQTAVRPDALAYGVSGLQFLMSNGGFWRLVGNTATPRPASAITPVTIPGPRYMIESPDGSYVIALSGTGNAYLYDALVDNFTAARLLYNQPPVSYFGPMGAAPMGNFYLVGGMILSPSLSLLGGAERPGVTQFGPPPAPGQPPTQTIVSAGQRNVASVFPISDFTFVRLTTPVRQNITATTRDDIRPTMELVDIRTGAESLVAIAPENPLFSVFGTARVNVNPRQLVVDSKGTAYALTISGISVMPLTLAGVPPRPEIPAGSRGIVNSSDGTPNFRPGSFITINGRDLASPAVADQLPPPTVLGGSCVVFNEVPLTLLQTSEGQISAQIPDSIRPGMHVVQVRSLLYGVQSEPVIVNVQR